MVRIKFLGAAKTVTGSSYLVMADNTRFLVDCGMFQGADVEDRNYLDFEFDPTTLDFVILTHAHIDHIGLVPKLIAKGFQGPIYMTPATAKIAYHLLLDAAKIQELQLKRNKKLFKQLLQPLYDTSDAMEAFNLFETYDYLQEFKSNGVRMHFEKVGHVLGAASVSVIVEGTTVFFSGDIGRLDHPFLEGFENQPKEVDYIVMESLYGGKYHEDREQMIKKMIQDINITLNRNGNVIIPAFALQRTQEILNILKNAYKDNLINRRVKVFLDSPLASEITSEYSHSIFKYNIVGKELFEFDELRFVRNSRRVLGTSASAIIIAGSGMADGGRVVNHLRRGLPDSRNSVFIVGFQAEKTLGRTLIQGPTKVVIDNKNVPVRAQINEYYGLSAHGDQADLDVWLHRFDETKLKKVFLVHAEPERIENLISHEQKKIDFYAPEWKEEVLLE